MRGASNVVQDAALKGATKLGEKAGEFATNKLKRSIDSIASSVQKKKQKIDVNKLINSGEGIVFD